MTNIYQTINAIMAELEPVGKNTKNTQQGFMYRGVDAVMNAMAPLFSKHKLFVVPEVINQLREERQTSKGNTLIYSIITMKYTFFAEDGSSVSSIVIGEGMDSGDKATNKAMSIAFKYACFQLFCIPTEETSPDPDKDCHEVKKTEQKKEESKQTERDNVKARVLTKGYHLGLPAAQLAKDFGLNESTTVERLIEVEKQLDKMKEDAQSE